MNAPIPFHMWASSWEAKMRWFFLVCCVVPGLGIAESGCLSSFDEFLSKFEADRSFQYANTLYPLKHSFIDMAADPEPRAVDKPLSKPEVMGRARSIYPSPAEQKEVPLIRAINSPTGTRSVVRLHQPDTGYLLIYYFERIDGCWKLVEFENAST